MRLILTHTPDSKLDGEAVVATLQSGPTTLEISLTPHEAIWLGRKLQAVAFDRIQPQPEAEVVAFSQGRA